MFGLVGGVVGAPDQRKIHWDAINVPLRHEEHDPKAEDIGMVLAEARFVGHRVFWAAFPLERTVAHQIQDAILGWRERPQGLVGKPPQQGLRAPIRSTQQAPVVLIRQRLGAMPGQGLQVGPFAVEEVSHQEPVEDQLVPMVETGPQDP